MVINSKNHKMYKILKENIFVNVSEIPEHQTPRKGGSNNLSMQT